LSLEVVVSASAAGLGFAPGAPWGQTGSVVWPGAGVHPDCCAKMLVPILAIASSKNSEWRTMKASDLEFAALILALL
jgi:hypothetical protein